MTQSQRIFQRGRRLRAFGLIILAGDDDILTAGQRFARQRLPCFAAHNDGFAVSVGFEKGKILGQMPRHGVVDADTAAGGIGGDKGDFRHNEIRLQNRMIIAEGRREGLNARYYKNVSTFIKSIFKILNFDKNHLLFIFLGI